MAKKRTARRKAKVRLIASEKRRPSVKLARSARYQVVATSLVDAHGTALRPSRRPRPPRLCGSRSTCMAIVELP